jgi:alkanesulfonate monooxygenase SsuD/methylene tetrahydromethanopterin reductase-like flavin-dependent oxidoreductase (luciferase family)
MTPDTAPDRMHLGRLGIWTYQLNYQPAAKAATVVAELEALGYGSLWIGEAMYREPLTHAGFLLASTQRMVIATGIANIWARDPFTMTAAQLTLAEAYPDRFLIDHLVAWGDLDAIRARVNDHLAAGADHVCIQVFDSDPHGLPLWQWREIANLTAGSVASGEVTQIGTKE